MNLRITTMRALAFGCLALLPGACERSLPTDGTAAAVPLRITAVTVGTPISTLVVQVTASDIPTPLVFNLSVVNGVASGTIKIPPGPARTIAVTAMDAAGNVTHEGSATIDVRSGQNPPVQIKLRPRSGQVPITVTFGNFGVVVTPPVATICATAQATLQLAVTVTDVNGQVIPGPAVGWATTNPAVATVSAAGLVTGVTNGTATIVATYEGVAGLSAVTVTAGCASRIAFVSDRDGNSEIYVMNPDGSAQANLTNNPASDYNPYWSLDGSRIAFVSTRDGNDEIYAMVADGTHLLRLTSNAATDVTPAWSPDGSKIAFASNRAGNFDICVMKADGSGVVNLTNNAAFDFDPIWSPDGSRIAFVSTREGNFEIYVMKADGSSVDNLTKTAGDEFEPAWSPDGSKLLFTRRSDNDPATPTDVVVMNVDGTGLVNVTNNPALDGTADWSPAGSKIVFQTRRDGNAEIYVMNADGTGVTRLTNSVAVDLDPSWGRIP